MYGVLGIPGILSSPKNKRYAGIPSAAALEFAIQLRLTETIFDDSITKPNHILIQKALNFSQPNDPPDLRDEPAEFVLL
jgi:hypothetical protein